MAEVKPYYLIICDEYEDVLDACTDQDDAFKVAERMARDDGVACAVYRRLGRVEPVTKVRWTQ